MSHWSSPNYVFVGCLSIFGEMGSQTWRLYPRGSDYYYYFFIIFFDITGGSSRNDTVINILALNMGKDPCEFAFCFSQYGPEVPETICIRLWFHFYFFFKDLGIRWSAVTPSLTRNIYSFLGCAGLLREAWAFCLSGWPCFFYLNLLYLVLFFWQNVLISVPFKKY